MSRLSEYTPLELLLLFRFIASHGFQSSAIEQVSQLLAQNAAIREDATFSLSRLQPAALAAVYQDLKAGVTYDHDETQAAPSLKRRPSSALKQNGEIPQSTEQISKQLYAQYKARLVAGIREDEEEIRQLRNEVAEIERGEWDERLQPQDQHAEQRSQSELVKSNKTIDAPHEDPLVDRALTSAGKSPTQQHGRSISIADLLSHDSKPPRLVSSQSDLPPVQTPTFQYPFQHSPPPHQGIPPRPDRPNLIRNVPPHLSVQTSAPSPQHNRLYDRQGHQAPYLPVPLQPSPNFHSQSPHQYSPSYSRMLPSPISSSSTHPSARQGFSPPYTVQHYPLPSPYGPNGHPPPHRPSYPPPRTPTGPYHGYTEQPSRASSGTGEQMLPPPVPAPPLPSQAPTAATTEPEPIKPEVPEPQITAISPQVERERSQASQTPLQTPISPIPPAPEDFSPISDQDTNEVTAASTPPVRDDPSRRNAGSELGEKAAVILDRMETDEGSSDALIEPRRAQLVGYDTPIRALRNLQRTSGPLLSDIGQHKFASLFAAPVRARDAPGYTDTVYRPQDFKSIRSSVSMGARALAAMSTSADQADKRESDVGGIDKQSQMAIVPNDDDWRPPKAIVTPAQLELEVARVFANAVMFNSEPMPTFALMEAKRRGRGSVMIEPSGRTGGANGKSSVEESSEEKRVGYEERDGAVVDDAKQMWESTRKLLTEWKGVGR